MYVTQEQHMYVSQNSYDNGIDSSNVIPDNYLQADTSHYVGLYCLHYH